VYSTFMLISYTAACFVCTLALMVQGLLVRENNRFDKKTKYIFYGTYAVIILSGLSEWGAVFLNGAPERFRGIHAFLKMSDYITGPMVGVCFARQVRKPDRSYKLVNVIIAVNTIIEIASVFTGWTFYLDADNVYHHGPFHMFYVAMYATTALFGFTEFIRYGKAFRKQNVGSLSLVLLTITICDVWQMLRGDVRVVYLGMTVCSMLLFVHYSEFGQLETDDELSLKKRLLENDAMTGVFSRHAYIEALEAYTNEGIPEDLAVFVSDINGLKTVNDELGHSAGDEVIKVVAHCLDVTFKACGRCYRIGGDEFVVFARMTMGEADASRFKIKSSLAEWHGIVAREANASVGYVLACNLPEHTAEQLVAEADAVMYEDKKKYYKSINREDAIRH
jgi:diguanylate cyclase (GGDEF)-like protein